MDIIVSVTVVDDSGSEIAEEFASDAFENVMAWTADTLPQHLRIAVDGALERIVSVLTH